MQKHPNGTIYKTFTVDGKKIGKRIRTGKNFHATPQQEASPSTSGDYWTNLVDNTKKMAPKNDEQVHNRHRPFTKITNRHNPGNRHG